ncbi:MAG TPA: hypothetical protein VHB30_06710, partial [Solirubrobacteraceae bacterium]|nr:hypothetical protein [Solirubrobacteraceae bacterium]
MRRSLLAAALAVSVAVPAGALAQSRYVTLTDTVTATVHKTGVQGTTLVYKGTVRSKLFGTGKVTERVANLGLDGTLSVVYEHGTVRGTSTAKPKAAPGGGFTVTGTYEITGGTGRSVHVRG